MLDRSGSSVGASAKRVAEAQRNLAEVYGENANVFNNTSPHNDDDQPIAPFISRPDIDAVKGGANPNGPAPTPQNNQLAITIPNSVPPSLSSVKYASPGSADKTLGKTTAYISVKNFFKAADYLNEKFISTGKTRWQTLEKADQKTILNLFRQKDRTGKALYYFVLSCAFGSLVGELFYLTFDYRARVDTLAPLIPSAVNYTVNGLIQPFIGCANFVFEPFDEANTILTKRLLKQSFGIYDNEHRVASILFSTAFFTFALSGGYVEIIGISDLLALTPVPAQVSIIFTLMFMAISYYFLFNFLDMIGNGKVWLNEKSTLKLMVSSNRPAEERLIDLYAALCEASTNIERVLRIAMGLFFAGLALGVDVAYVFAVFAGLCTLPVSIGTRGYTARSLFSPELTADNFVRHEKIKNADAFMERYKDISQTYEDKRQESWKSWAWAEIQLMFSPFLWLQLALVVFASLNIVPEASSTDEATNDAERTAAVLGVVFMYALTQVLARFPNRREHLIAATVKSIEAEKPSALNGKGEALATTSSGLDTASRVITFVFGMQVMTPNSNVFDISTPEGLEHCFYVACFAAWIAANPYHYQKNRVRGAFSKLPIDSIKKEQQSPNIVVLEDELEAKKGIVESCTESLSACWTGTKDKVSNCWATTFSGSKVNISGANENLISAGAGSDGYEADEDQNSQPAGYIPPKIGNGYTVEA